MKNLFTFFVFLFSLLFAEMVVAQGCVAIRHFSSCNGNNLSTAILPEKSFFIGTNYRYFKSFRHFRGKHEEADRVANGTEVINKSHSVDVNLAYGVTDRFYVNASIPVVYNDRSSLYEHGRTERHWTRSAGVADIRIGAGYWLISPTKSKPGNIAVGAGIKLPTGNYKATDIFYNVGPEASPEVRPVDQSIQPGDGGVGLALDMQLYRELAKKLFLYGNGFYLFNPRETNGTRTFRETLNPLLQNEAIMSVPDQFGVRAGVNYTIASSGFGVSAGFRYEGVPVRDVFGGSAGFRRPGTVGSFEPGLNYMKNGWSFNLFVPISVSRNRPRSVTDIETEKLTNQPRHGDAAFADYLINVSINYLIFPKK